MNDKEKVMDVKRDVLGEEAAVTEDIDPAKDSIQQDLLTTAGDIGKLQVGGEPEEEEAAATDEIEEIREEMTTKAKAVDDAAEEAEDSSKGQDFIPKFFNKDLQKKFSKLKSAQIKNLCGTYQIKISDQKETFNLNITDKALELVSDLSDADCELEMNSKVLKKLSSGKLNPQIGLLSKQIKVSGSYSRASYFFNLV